MSRQEDLKGYGELLDEADAERNAEPKFAKSFDRTKIDVGVGRLMPDGVREEVMRRADAMPVSPLAAFKDNTFTPEERKRRQSRILAAQDTLFSSDIERMTPEFAAGFYRAIHKALFDLEDPDGRVAFGSRASDDPKKNLDMLKRFCRGEHQLVSSDEKRAWDAMPWEEKFRYALEHETAGNKVASNLEGDRGSTIFELAGAGMPGAQFGNTMLNADAPNKADIIRRTQYDLMTPEEKRKYEADVIGDYEERMLKDNRLAAYLELTAGLSDKAKWLVAKGVNDGECDMDALRQLRGAEPERALTAIKMARGNLMRGQILGIDTDFSTGTAGDRLQMGLYGFQQGVIGLFADTAKFAENVGAYGVAKALKDDKEFREFSDAMSFRAKMEQAFSQDLPESESFMGEAYQGVMENLHWGLSWGLSAYGKGLMAGATGIARPTLGATLKALAAKPSAWKSVIAEYGRTFKLMPNAKLADMGKGLKAAEAVFARKQMKSLVSMMAARAEGKETAQLVNPFVGEYLTRQAAAVDRLRKNYDAARRIAMRTDGLGAGLATTGSMASFATFAQEYMDNAVAAGVDWDDALVTAVGVGLINAKIENIWIPGVEGGLTRDEIGRLTWASFQQALANTIAKNGKRGLKDYFANWARKYAASAGRAAFEEGIIEEPLQQIVIEHGIEFDKILKEYGYTGPTQVLKAFLPTADDWKTFVDTAIEMLPNDFGFALTSLPMAVGRQSRNQAVHNLWARKWRHLRDEAKRRRDWVADHGSLDGYKPAPMPTMYTATGELSPEMVKGDYSNVTDLDYGVVDMIQNEINLQQLVKDEWEGKDKGSVTDDPKKERGTRLKVAEKIQVARDVWRANDGTGDVVGAVADALGVGRRTAEVACSTFEAEGDFTDFNAKARTVLNANFVLASLTEADLKEINPNFVDGSFERDEKTGSVKAEILINMGKDENGKDREPVRKTVVYRIGSSVLSEEDIPVAAARGSKFGDSWIGTHKGEIVNGRRVETWDELTDDERLELVKRDRWIAKGSAGPGATVVFTDKDGNEKKIDADFLVSFATGRIGDIGYGVAAKRSTMFHENFHVLWDSVKEFIPEEDRKNLARKLDVDVEKGDWDSRLQEKMAIQLEAYSGGQMVPQFSQNVIEGMQGGIRGALGGLLDMMAPKTIDPKTGKEYGLKDFYDAVLRGDIGNAAELLKASAGKMPEKDGGTKPSDGKLPGSVTAEELAAKDAETAKSGEDEAKSEEGEAEAATPHPQPSHPTVRRPSWDHGDRVDRKCPGKKWKLKCKLVLMSVHDLVTQQAQGRDVTAKDYKDRVDEMARTWEIEEGTKIDNTVLLGVPTAFTKDVVPGAVDKSVFAGNTRTSAILKIYENGGDMADAYRESQEQIAEERGLEKADGWENDPIVVALLEEVEVPESEKMPTAQEIADASNVNIASAYGASESAGAHATILIANNLIPLFQIDSKTGLIVDNDEAYGGDKKNPTTGKAMFVNPIGEFYRKAGGKKALPDFYRKDTTNLSEDGQRILRNAILSALFGGRGGETVARLMSEADRLGMQNEMAALVQLAPELLSLANDREHAKYDLRGPLVEALRWVQRWLDADEAARKSAGKTHAEWKRRMDGRPVEPAALATTWENFREGDMTEKPSDEAVILGDLLAAAHQTLAWFQEGEGGEERPSEASKLTARRLVTGYVRDYLDNVRHATAPVEDGLFGGTEDAAAFAPPTTAEILRTRRGTRFSVAMSSAIESLVDPRVANSVTEAGETLKASGAVNRPLTNQILGLTAKITGNGLSKMTSEKATKKSRSPYLHALAVANADKIFECAFSDATHPDTHGRKEVLQVHRLGSMLYDPQAKRFEPVLVTMIEYKRDGENIYTLEAIDVDAYQKKNSAGQLVAFANGERQTPIAEYVGIIANRVSAFNGESAYLALAADNRPTELVDKVRQYFPDGTRFSVGTVQPATAEEYAGIIERVGETKDVSIAQWLFPDGRMPKPQMKQLSYGTVRSHDGIFFLLNHEKRPGMDASGVDLTGYIDTFAGGAMRLDLDNGGIEMTRKPSDVQMDAIYDICEAAYQKMEMDDLDTFRVDISDDNGSTLFTLEYPRKTSARRIIDDIKNYYDSGWIPDNATGPEVERRGGTGAVRFSIGQLYTGSAADYKKPSLHYVGTGEGSQVYGLGLYASSERGVAERYSGKKIPSERVLYKGEKIESISFPKTQKDLALYYVRSTGSYDSGLDNLSYEISKRKGGDKKKYQEAKQWLVENKDDFIDLKKYSTLYEQTFFTNRAPGDESHLLKWYEPVSEEQKKWIIEGFQNGRIVRHAVPYVERRISDIKKAKNGGEVYQILEKALGSPQAASEFLARADIDGIKYPVDSYGKTVKDGDLAGWNYVSFRDDNIRVDHKWVDGQQRWSIGGSLGSLRAGRIRDFDAALRMLDRNYNPLYVWKKTGYWRGKDGRLRFEIPDGKMKDAESILKALKEHGNNAMLGEIMDAPELFRAYPDLEKLKVHFDPEPSDSRHGFYSPSDDSITVNRFGLYDYPDLWAKRLQHEQRKIDDPAYLDRFISNSKALEVPVGSREEELAKARGKIGKINKDIEDYQRSDATRVASDPSREILIHEIQHAIQEREGFAKGMAGEVARKYAREILGSTNADDAWLNAARQNTEELIAAQAELKLRKYVRFGDVENAKPEEWSPEALRRLDRFTKDGSWQQYGDSWSTPRKSRSKKRQRLRHEQIIKAIKRMVDEEVMSKHPDYHDMTNRELEDIVRQSEKWSKDNFQKIRDEEDKRELASKLSAMSDYEIYLAFTGEVEARQAVARAKMSDAERAETPPWESEDIPRSGQIVRYSVAASPTLREDVEAALLKRDAAHPDVIQRGRHDEIVFSENIPVFEFLGLPNLRVVTEVSKIRKFAIKHHLSVDQIVDIPNGYDNPVAIMSDDDGYVLLTDRQVTTDDGEQKPMRLFLRPTEWRSGEIVLLATAMAENGRDELEYYEPRIKAGLMFADENRIAGLNLGEETESILRIQASGENVKTAADFSTWRSTQESISKSGAGGNAAQRKFSIGPSPSEPLVRAMDRRTWRNPRVHGVDSDVRWSVGGTIDEAFPQLREMSDDELVIAAEAVRLALNTKGKGRFMNITRMQRDLRGLDPSQSHADLGVRAVGVTQAARNLAKKMRADLDRGVSESKILAHLPDTMKEVFGSEMTARLRTGAKAGVYAERARKEIERRQEKVITDAVAIQSGVETKIMENAYGLDFSRTLMNLAENPYIRTDENGNRLPPERGEGEDGGAVDEQTSGSAAKPVEAKVAEAVNEVARRAHELSEAEKAKKEELRRQAGRDAENQLAFNQEENAAAADAGEGGGAMFTGDEDLVDVATRKAGVNLADPRELALFVSELSRKYWNDTHGLGNKPDTWNDPVAMQFLRKTAANIYTKLVNDLVYSQARDTATRAINRFENVPTARGLVSEMTFVGQLIHAKRMADTQREMCNKLDAFLKEKFGTTGRFSPDKEELRRTVSAEMELRARYTRHVIWLTPDALNAETEAMRKNLHDVEVEFDDAGRDVDQSKVMVETVRKLQLLREFGGLVYKPLAQIQAAIEYWEDALRGDTDRIVRDNYERDILTEKAAAKLAAAFDNPKLKTALEKNWKSLFNGYIESHMGFFVLLRDLMRFAPDDVRKDAEPIIEYLELAVQKAGTRAMSGKRRHCYALAQAVQSIYRRDFRKVLAEFNQRDDRFLEFMGEVSPGKREIPTKGKAMQLFVSLLQVGHPVEVMDKDGGSHVEWIGGYHDNIVKNHREGQAEKIRRLLSVEDLNLIAWLGKWYEANRENLSTIAEALFGIGVYAETANYMPVKMLLDPQGLEKGNAVGWTVFPRSLTPRIRNERDFDTSADILSMFMSRMEESEQWAAHAKLGLELRGIFGRSVLRKSIRASHGESTDKLVQGFITDILAGRGAGDLTTGGFSFYADKIRGMAALGALGGNLGVTLKQMTSIPAFGFELGLAKTAKYILSAWSPDGFAAMREIFDSDERKNRWDVGNSEAVKNALSMNASGTLMKMLKASMITNKVGDVVPALVVGQGIYRDALAQGMSREDAMARTWMLIERTQQSSRLENQPEFVRRSRAARALFQFLTTQVQYLGYEAKAIREVMAKPGDVRRWGSLGSTLVLNHFLLSSLYYWMGQLWKRLLGQEPPPDDELADWMVTCLLGPFGALYVAGFTATEALNVWVKGKKFGSQPTLPSLSWASNIVVHDPGSVLSAIFSHDKGTLDDVLSAAGKWLADFNATFRDLRKVYRYRVKKEPQRK